MQRELAKFRFVNSGGVCFIDPCISTLPEAEDVLTHQIEGNQGLELLYQRLEWILSRAPFRGMRLDYSDHDFWLYELEANRSDLPTLQAVYSIKWQA